LQLIAISNSLDTMNRDANLNGNGTVSLSSFKIRFFTLSSYLTFSFSSYINLSTLL